MSAIQAVGNRRISLTPSRYASLNRRVQTPTCIFGFMLLMSPGNVSEIETIIAAAARQFCERHEGQDTRSTFGKAYDSICIPIPSVRLIHRGNVNMSVVYEPILSGSRDKIRESFVNEMEKYIPMAYVGDHDSGYRAHEDGVTTHER